MIQTLPMTLGVAHETWIILDALRKKRNINDYSGDLMGTGSVRECIAQAECLLETLQQWLADKRPDLLEPTE